MEVRVHASPPMGLGRGFGPCKARALQTAKQPGEQRQRSRAKGLQLIRFPFSNVRSPLG
jgi:hypothetical protein